jgi:hypothetical protein
MLCAMHGGVSWLQVNGTRRASFLPLILSARENPPRVVGGPLLSLFLMPSVGLTKEGHRPLDQRMPARGPSSQSRQGAALDVSLPRFVPVAYTRRGPWGCNEELRRPPNRC